MSSHHLISADTQDGWHCDQCFACGQAWDYPTNTPGANSVVMLPAISYTPCESDTCTDPHADGPTNHH